MHIIKTDDRPAKGDLIMPYLDGTGPYGSGPIGWGRGPCRAGGRMGGRGMGIGWGAGMPVAPTYAYVEPAPADVRRSMEMEAEILERRLKLLKDRMQELGSDSQ